MSNEVRRGGQCLWILLCLVGFVGQAAAAMPAAGLRLYGTDRTALGQAPLLRTDVSMNVTGALLRVHVTQAFRNVGEQWVEGVYVFPLPEDAAVDRLRMRYGGRVIVGEVQERAAARQRYEQAREHGQGAALVEQERANLFTTAVANIPPQATVLVEIEYQQQVDWRDGEFSLRFPMVVAPRYISGAPLAASSGDGWAPDTDQVPDASRITPPVVEGADPGFNALSLQVELHSGLALARVESPYHAVEVSQPGPGHYRVGLAADSVPAERDFVLRWRPQLAEQPSVAVFGERWRDQDYVLLMLMPPQPDAMPPAPPRELILVVDNSGSMHGDSIEQARDALAGALRRLRPGDRFNVIRFNDTAQALFPQAVPARPEHLAQALGFVRGLQAQGGTEMLPALRLALDEPVADGRLRQVVFITDGAVGNEEALFGLIAARLGASRLFTVGIGSAPNALFMRKAAAFGRGSFTYIGSTREVERQVERLFDQLATPAATDLQLAWEDADGRWQTQGRGLVQTPDPLPDLYAGEPLTVAVQAADPPRRVRVMGWIGGRPWEQTLALPPPSATGGPAGDAVHGLWARRSIDDWMARLTLGEAPERVRAAVLGLALEHGLVSRYTSLVAVDRTPSRPADEALAKGAVPTRLPAGWSGEAVFGRLPGTATPSAMAGLLGLAALLLGGLLARRRT